MSKKTMAGLSVVLVLGGIVGLEMGGLSTIILSVFAIGIGVIGAKKSIFG